MILVDTNVFMYAAGGPHQHKTASSKFLHDVARREYSCCLNTEVLQEILHRYRAIDRWEAGREVFYLAKQIVPTVQAITLAVMEKTVELMDGYPHLMARDCVHAAHCMVDRLDGICSFDTDFDLIEGLDRIEPGL